MCLSRPPFYPQRRRQPHTLTSTTPLSGTVVTMYTYDTANRLTDRAVSDGRTYTYDWSDRGQLLTEWTQGYPVRTFTYDGAGQMVAATLFTQTTKFTYNGLGARVAVEVVGYGTTAVTLDLAAGNRILAEGLPVNCVPPSPQIPWVNGEDFWRRSFSRSA